MAPKTYSATDVARELGRSPLYIHRILRDSGITKTHGIYIVTEAELAALRKKYGATKPARRGAAA